MGRRALWRHAARAASLVGPLAIFEPARHPRFAEAMSNMPCPRWQCRSNSPAVDSTPTASRAFHELHLAGEPNSAGFTVAGVRKGATPYVLEVEGANVLARALGQGGPVTGAELVPTTVAERQAMLKMFTADVCGDGTSFTVHGQPLLWADAKGVTSFARPPGSLEAIWTDRGALCLDTPRRPDQAAVIAARCGGRLPRCAELPEAARAEGYVISATPR